MSLNEQRHLLEALTLHPTSASDELQRVRDRIARTTAPAPAERDAIYAALDRASAEIDAAWTSDKSALEAVQEQRRDL